MDDRWYLIFCCHSFYLEYQQMECSQKGRGWRESFYFECFMVFKIGHNRNSAMPMMNDEQWQQFCRHVTLHHIRQCQRTRNTKTSNTYENRWIDPFTLAKVSYFVWYASAKVLLTRKYGFFSGIKKSRKNVEELTEKWHWCYLAFPSIRIADTVFLSYPDRMKE